MPTALLQRLIKTESAGGFALIAASLLAMLWANSPWASSYTHVLHLTWSSISLQHMVNDGLMTLFFLLVGLEIKRELLVGELSHPGQRLLPTAAALGGMLVPMLIYLAFNAEDPLTARGWAIPAATDIAFALAALSLLGSRVPTALKVLLTAIAILDDLGAILILATFYSSTLHIGFLICATILCGALHLINRAHLHTLWPRLAIGALMWLCILHSGLHATLTGVLLAVFIPLGLTSKNSPLHKLEHSLQPYIAWLVLPLFGLANAGVQLHNINLTQLTHPLTLGITAGLFLGKQIGIMLGLVTVLLLTRTSLPTHITYRHLYGLALLCGIGFTMSLFISNIAFPSSHLQQLSKLGILIGSLFSAIAGLTLLATAPKHHA